MMSSFYSGLTGLSANAAAINVVGNNLSNVNTSGFKSSKISFGDLVTTAFSGISTDLAGNPMQNGLGVLPSSVNGIFSQGPILSTSEASNVAIEGNGFFIVGNSVDDRYYTRDGNFKFNEDGRLIYSDGKFVLGYPYDDATEKFLTSTISTIDMPANIVSNPSASTYFNISANLNVNDPATSTYTASSTIYDSKGTPHTITIEFTHNGTNGAGNDEWGYSVSASDATLNPATPTGTFEFDGTGNLINPTATNPWNIPLDITAFANGANPMTLNWNVMSESGAGLLTGFPLQSAINYTNSDGYMPGNLISIMIDKEGVVNGVFSNGQVEPRFQLAMANFNNPKGLMRNGNNLFVMTDRAGLPSEGPPATGGRGTVVSKSLEASNVDMATEFTNMIIFERGYQANSRVITTSDNMIQEALSLKR